MVYPTPIKIGIPHALSYHKYAPLWKTFFRALGCQLVISPETNRQILDNGSRLAVDETCLAVKIYLGHIHHLLDRVDYLFIPRFVSINTGEKLCIKLLALGDIVRNIFETDRVLEYTVDHDLHQYEMVGLIKLGLKLCPNLPRVLNAYRQAVVAQKASSKQKIQKQMRILQKDDPSRIRILIVAHAYVSNDAMMGKTVVKQLREQDVDIVYADWIDDKQARRLSTSISSDLYWTYHKELLGGIEAYKHQVDGILFLMAFPCGPDALVINLCQNQLTDIPTTVLTLDELQADAGIKTRIESFVDILRFKKERIS